MCILKIIRSVQKPCLLLGMKCFETLILSSVLLQILITWNIFSLNRKRVFDVISSTQRVGNILCLLEKPFPWFVKILKCGTHQNQHVGVENDEQTEIYTW